MTAVSFVLVLRCTTAVVVPSTKRPQGREVLGRYGHTHPRRFNEPSQSYQSSPSPWKYALCEHADSKAHRKLVTSSTPVSPLGRIDLDVHPAMGTTRSISRGNILAGILRETHLGMKKHYISANLACLHKQGEGTTTLAHLNG